MSQKYDENVTKYENITFCDQNYHILRWRKGPQLAAELKILTLPEKVADTEITKAADVNIAMANGCAQACGVYSIDSQRR